jgi:hypothetical protein
MRRRTTIHAAAVDAKENRSSFSQFRCPSDSRVKLQSAALLFRAASRVNVV